EINKDIEWTDLKRWRLEVNNGRQTWHYLENESEIKNWPQSTIEKYWLGLPFKSRKFIKPVKASEAAKNGFKFFKQLQTEDGFWAGECGGIMFLTPVLIFSMYITRIPIPESWRIEMIRYLFNRAHPVDGGWGIHMEQHSTVFGTTMNYVVLRILGVDAGHPIMVKARSTLHEFGGATGIPFWGKFWLASLNVYDWEGVNPIPPELWLLPQFLPIHPSQYWVHTRSVYLPMGYIYGHRFSAEETPLIIQLRQELYTQPYETISWDRARDNVTDVDLFLLHSKLLNLCNFFLRIYEKIPNFFGIRDIALQESYELIQCEDINTDYLDLALISKSIHILCTYHEKGPDSKEFQLAKERIIDHLWINSEGMFANLTNGCQLWDTALMSLALMDTGLAEDPAFHKSMTGSLKLIDRSQFKKDPENYSRCYRDKTKGGWGFSTRDQGYVVSDCTSIGINYMPKLISKERFCQAIDILLSMQNRDGGFSSYESIRGPSFLELLNPSEVFGNAIMTDHSYPECTSCVLTAFSTFSKYYPDYRAEEIKKSCEKAIQYIHDSQRADGSWYGSWGICFTYAAMFTIECLANFGETYENSESVRKGCKFLITKQKKDEYVQHEKSQVVNTSWALLALMYARYPYENDIRRGVMLLMSRQLSTGEWKQEAIEGVANKTCAMSYPNYKFIFAIWALGKYAKIYNDP
ncbi:679_t:CDS:10, partial [Diversispora eburnea]